MRVKTIAAAVAGAATALAVAERRVATRGRRRAAEHRSDMVDEAGRESFPASDPPGWTLGEDRD